MIVGEKGYGKNLGKFLVFFVICDIYCICIECMYCEKFNCIIYVVVELYVWVKV